MKDLILGTAGHIDHGKSSLIRALTGTDPDRLPEEKKRGITIELGFAELCLDDYRFGIVDVPGHERFIRNMLAGASGMDVAMLVVAADDSIKPQTREHLDILKMLNLQTGVIAITKCDLAEPDWLELVKEEVRELVKGSFLESAPIVEVSSKTGQNLDQLKAALIDAANQTDPELAESQNLAPFRMAIDRVFTIAGHGTVVTGSVISGTTKLGDDLLLQPGAHEVRVRGLQNHDRSVDQVHRGQRAAINLTGIHHGEIKRGQELCAPGYLKASDLLSVRVTLLPDGKAVKDRQRVRAHIGTEEIPATIRLLETKQLTPGETGLAQLFLRHQSVASWHQPFVLRDDSETFTLGGGVVIHPNASRQRGWDEIDLQTLKQLDSNDETSRVAAAYYFANLSPLSTDDVRRITGISSPGKIVETLIEQGTLRSYQPSPSQTRIVHADRIRIIGDRIAKTVANLHERNPLQSKFEIRAIRHRFEYIDDDQAFQLAIRDLVKRKIAIERDGSISLNGFGPQLSKNEQKVLDEIVKLFAASGLAPPTIDDCKKSVSKNKDSVPQLVELAIANGDLERISKDVILYRDTASQTKTKITALLRESSQGMTMAELRDAMETTRKYAVPICEYLDRIGLTIRNEDVRLLNPNYDPEMN